jgi:hypothetical protein
LLQQHAKDFPQWSAAIEMLIGFGCFVVVPVRKELRAGPVEACDLLVLEPGVKGPPAAYHIEGTTLYCVNYPSVRPQSLAIWIASVITIAASVEAGDKWMEGMLSQ